MGRSLLALAYFFYVQCCGLQCIAQVEHLVLDLKHSYRYKIKNFVYRFSQ